MLHHLWRLGAIAVLVAGSVVGVGAVAHADDQQPYIRMMTPNRYDILMASRTRAIATNPAQAAWACKEVIGAGAAGGPLGVFATGATCIPAVTVCAAQAAVRGKWAGMTFTVVPPNFWCWKY